MKQKKIQEACNKRDDIIKILNECFLQSVSGEDNSWRVTHNLIELQIQFERKLFEYLVKNSK